MHSLRYSVNAATHSPSPSRRDPPKSQWSPSSANCGGSVVISICGGVLQSDSTACIQSSSLCALSTPSRYVEYPATESCPFPFCETPQYDQVPVRFRGDSSLGRDLLLGVRYNAVRLLFRTTDGCGTLFVVSPAADAADFMFGVLSGECYGPRAVLFCRCASAVYGVRWRPLQGDGAGVRSRTLACAQLHARCDQPPRMLLAQCRAASASLGRMRAGPAKLC